MKLSQIAALLGLDETEAIRPVPLRLPDEETPTPTPNRAQRRAQARHERESRPLLRR